LTQVTHNPCKPVSVMREENDVLVVEGVRFDGDFFRTLSDPDPESMYVLRKLENGCVGFIEIDTLEKAKKFFEETAKG